MQTAITEAIKSTAEGQEADRILRKCVHCGFCNATCPTYQLLGDELDGPRGRIYLIKNLLEQNEVSQNTQQHLDRCLGCRACESTCPSGVDYGRLLDIGRAHVETQVGRSLYQRLVRRVLTRLIPYRNRFRMAYRLANGVRPLLPQSLKMVVPVCGKTRTVPANRHSRKMLVLDGCVQSVLAPDINAAAASVLDTLGISLLRVEEAGCCGAVNYHLSDVEQAKCFARNNIDAWWPYVQQGIEAIVITASGCGTMVKEYDTLLRDDPEYQRMARRVAALTRDISEVIAAQDLSALERSSSSPRRIAFHSPCSLQHGQKLTELVEPLLKNLGFELTDVPDSHLCCGSAGTYSLLQPVLARQLVKNKLSSLQSGTPQAIVTANIGCQHYLGQRASVPVFHWIQLLDEATW